jgi:hypothetical protein
MMNRSILRAAVRSIQAGPTSVAGRRYASSAVFNWEDPLAAAELFTEEELAIQDTARQYCQDKLAPRILGMHNLLCFVLMKWSTDVSDPLQRPTAMRITTVES